MFVADELSCLFHGSCKAFAVNDCLESAFKYFVEGDSKDVIEFCASRYESITNDFVDELLSFSFCLCACCGDEFFGLVCEVFES